MTPPRPRPLLGARGLLLALAALLSFALATSGTPPADRVADAAADAAVREWLAGRLSPDPARPPADPVEGARRLLSFSSPPREARVSYGLREFVGTVPADAADNTPERRLYRYPITSPTRGDESLTITLERAGSGWRPVAARLGSELPGIPDWVGNPAAGWIFLALTAALAYGVLGPTPWRRWLAEGWAAIRARRRIYLFTNLLLYGAVVLGMAIGAAAPELVRLLREVLASSFESRGVSDLLSGSVPNAALGIAYNNFVLATLQLTFLPGAVIGVLPYLLHTAQFLAVGLVFTPASFPLAGLLLHLPVFVVELQAYILVTAGAGVLLARLLREGLRVYPVALRDYAKTLPWALTLLVAAAWYEAWEVLSLAPAVLGR